jgi:hypothetical protein
VARLLARAFGSGRREALAEARAAELRGELAQAAALFAEAGRLDESARVMVLRGDAEVEPSARLRHYTQAVATAPADTIAGKHAARKRASTVVDIAIDTPMTATLRQELVQAARELEALGDPERAAQAYAMAGDLEGEVRALARAGDVDKVDALLVAAQGRDREAQARRRASEEVAMLAASGRRREGLALARSSTDDQVRSRGDALANRRVGTGVVRAVVRGRELLLALGDSLVIGRAPDLDTGEPRQGTISIGAAALSRRHIAVERRGEEFVVRDLGSRNGTVLRGLALAGETLVGAGIELRLGREVPVTLRPSTELAGALAVEVPGARYIAPLGPAILGIGQWQLASGDDGWIELVTGDAPPAFAGALRLAPAITLLAGDALAAERCGAPVLEIRGRDA